jgi:hypothetical protein
MPKKSLPRPCPECGETVPAEPRDPRRREFLKTVGAGAAALALARVPSAWGAEARRSKTAEDLIKELYGDLNEEQKKSVVAPYDSDARLKIYNSALGKRIGDVYTKTQRELVDRILRAICSDEEGYRQISRGGTWDASKSFENCGANLFGDLSGKYTWVFSGHHLTIRCDGDSVEGPAFGGPLYYGHSPNGYSTKNLFFYQTKSVLSVFDALTEAQRKQAVVKGSPGEGAGSIKFRPASEAKPGVAYAELAKDTQALVETVMKDVLSPYRKADAEEVMKIIKDQGGMEKVHLAFYQDDEPDPKQPWHFWRLEGPGFVWNYRVLPHVHTYVNISSKA